MIYPRAWGGPIGGAKMKRIYTTTLVVFAIVVIIFAQSIH